jgi:hypothetical protein
VLDVVQGPLLPADRARAAAFDALLDRAVRDGGEIPYDLPHPRHEFLSHAVHRRGLLAHGSNRGDIEEFEPRPANDAGTVLVGLHAASDAIRPLFFATVARRPGRMGTYNGGFVIGRGDRLRRYYFFATTTDPDDPESWTEGTVYLLPRRTFRHAFAEEWISDVPVRPVARLRVSPDDFPFRRATARFGEGESFGAIRRRFRRRARSA